MAADALSLGIQAARQGDYKTAQAYFIEVVKSDPNSEKGWLYLGHCLQEQEKRAYCYKKVLAINPSNEVARKALASITNTNLPSQTQEKQTSQRNPPPSSQSAVTTARSTQVQKTAPEKGKKSFSWQILAGGLGVFVCIGIIFVSVLISGFQGQIVSGAPARGLPAATTELSITPSATVTASPTIAPSSTPTNTPRPTFTDIPTYTPFSFLTPGSGSFSVSPGSKSMNELDALIAQDPNDADAYYQRATLIFESAVDKGSQAAYTALLEQALEDIDKAIAIRNDMGDYYALRQSIYYSIANNYQFTVDREYVYRLALDNAYKAFELGTTEQYPERIIVIDLILTNQCELALRELQKLMDNTPKEASNYGGLLHIQSQAYACLGRLDKAIKSVEASMFNNKNMEHKKQLKIEYLLQVERYDEALALINELLTCCPNYGGYRYYWRAAIYYEQGKKDLAKQDLYTGMANSWDRGGMLPYLEAKFALDDGRKEEAIELLQIAEATMLPDFNSLRWKIQKQLAELGARTLNPSISAPYKATPIP